MSDYYSDEIEKLQREIENLKRAQRNQEEKRSRLERSRVQTPRTVPTVPRVSTGYQTENLLTVVTEKMSDDDVRNQIASMKVNSMSNLIGTQGSKALNGAKSFGNLVGGLFGHGHAFTKKHVKDPKEQYQDCVNDLQWVSRATLNSTFRRMLTDRAVGHNRSVSDAELSAIVVDKAADYLKINGNLTPAEKIDVVFKAYFERLSAKMQERIRNFTPAQREELARSIQKEYDKLSEEKKQKMMRVSNLNNDDWKEIMYALKTGRFSEEEVRSLLGTTGLAGLAWGAGSSFAFYTMVPVIMHGFFTTLLNITLPFAAYTGAVSAASVITGPIGFLALAGYGVWKYSSSSKKVDGELYCQIIFAACAALGRSFAPNEDDLPEWAVQRTQAQIQSDEEYTRLRQQSQNAEMRAENAARRAAAATREVHQLRRQLAERKRNERPNSFDVGIPRLEQALKDAQGKEQQAIQQKTIADNDYTVSLQREYPEFHQRKAKLVRDLTEWGNDTTLGIKSRFSMTFVGQLAGFSADLEQNILKSLMELRNGSPESDGKFPVSHTSSLIAYNYSYANKLLTVEKVTDKLADKLNEDRDLQHTKKLAEIEKENLRMKRQLQKANEANEQYRLNESNLNAQINNLTGNVEHLREDNARLRTVTYLNDEIRPHVFNALKSAKYEIDISCPWINYRYVVKDMLPIFENLLRSGGTLKIRYGFDGYTDRFGHKQRGTDPRTIRSAQQLNNRLRRYPGFHLEEIYDHTKLILCDETYYIDGSFNFLNNSGNGSPNGDKINVSQDAKRIRIDRKRYFNF